MDASSLLNQIDRLKAQLRDEEDWVTKWEMRRTVRHLYKQYREATTKRTPWYGFRSNVIYLVVVFLIVAGSLAAFVRNLGFWATVGACFLATLVLVVLTGMVFLLMRILSPAQYQNLVEKALTSFQNLWGHSASRHVQELQASEDEKVGK